MAGVPKADRLTRAMAIFVEAAVDEVEAGLPAVVQTRLKRGVVASIALLQDAVARAHVEVHKAKPNPATLALGGKAAVALLEGTGVLRQFHQFDGRGVNAENLSDILLRAESLRLELSARAAHIEEGVVQPGAGSGGLVEAEAHEESESGVREEEERGRARVGGDWRTPTKGGDTPPHPAEAKTEFPPQPTGGHDDRAA